MPLLLPSLSLPRLPLSFPLPLPHTSATKHCVQLVDLDQADAAYAFQREHSAWEESPAPPPNTPNKPEKAKKNVNMNNASQLDVALEFGGDFEREWGLRFGGVEEEGCRNESCETVIHDAPPGVDVEEMAEEIETEESEEEEDEFLLDTPGHSRIMAATIRGRFKSALVAIRPKNSSAVNINKTTTTAAAAAAPHQPSRLQTERPRSARRNDKTQTTTASMSNPARPPRWRCCRCGRVNGDTTQPPTTPLRAAHNKNPNTSTQTINTRTGRPFKIHLPIHPTLTKLTARTRTRGAAAAPAAATSVSLGECTAERKGEDLDSAMQVEKKREEGTGIGKEKGTWTCHCGHAFEPCALKGRLSRLRGVQRRGGDLGVAFVRGE
ncbi:hypothetical protein IWX49DRAFT_557595 [Phyllosticta citricarpa]